MSGIELAVFGKAAASDVDGKAVVIGSSSPLGASAAIGAFSNATTG